MTQSSSPFSRTPEAGAAHSGPKFGLGRKATHRFFRSMADGVRMISQQPPGRFLRRRLLSSIHYAKKGVQIAEERFEGLSIAYLTDLHAGHLLSSDDLIQVFDHMNEQAPDVICFGGDMIDTRPQDLDLLRRPLARLRPRLGCFAVPGNHEYQVLRSMKRFYAFLEDNGVTPLHNRGVRLESGQSSLWLAGVDDATHGDPSVTKALEGRRKKEPTVLLSHHPDVFPVSAKRGVDLQLSGHTHGGQISLLGWRPVRHSSRGYMEGAYWRGSSALYVSRGVGVTALPLRVGVSAEVPLFDLRQASKETRTEWAQNDFELLSPNEIPVIDAPGEAAFLGLEEPHSALPTDVDEEHQESPLPGHQVGG